MGWIWGSISRPFAGLFLALRLLLNGMILPWFACLPSPARPWPRLSFTLMNSFLRLFQLVTYAPFTLFPSPVPRRAFQQVLDVQVHYNTLVDKISQDADFLQAALARCVRSASALPAARVRRFSMTLVSS